MSNLKIMLYFYMLVGNNSLLNILLPSQDNKVIKDVLKEADSKALNSMLKNSGSVQGVLKELFTDIKNGTKSNETITNILKNSSMFKDMGNFTTSLKSLVSQLQNDDSLSKYKPLLQSFLKDISTLDDKNLKELLGKSGVFLEAKILSKGIQTNIPSKLQDLLVQIKDLIKNIDSPQAKQVNDLISKLLTTPNQNASTLQGNVKEVITLLQDLSKNLTDKNVQNLNLLTNQLKTISSDAQLIESKLQNSVPINNGEKQQLISQTKDTLIQLKNEVLSNKNIDSQNLTKQIDSLLNSKNLFSSDNKIEPKNLLSQLLNSNEIKKESIGNSNISNIITQLKNITDQISTIENKIYANKSLLGEKAIQPQIKEALNIIKNELLMDKSIETPKLQNILKQLDTIGNTKDLLQNNNLAPAKIALSQIIDSPAIKNSMLMNPKLEEAINQLKTLVTKLDTTNTKTDTPSSINEQKVPISEAKTQVQPSIVNDKQVAINSMESKLGLNNGILNKEIPSQTPVKNESAQVISNEKSFLLNQLKETLSLLKNELNVLPNKQTAMLNQVIDKLTAMPTLFDKIELPPELKLSQGTSANISTFQSTFSSNINSLLLNLKENITNLSLNPQASNIQNEILKTVDKIENVLKEGILTPTNLANIKNETTPLNSDIKTILLQMQEELSLKIADPKNMETNKLIDKLLFQVDYHQLYSLSSNSSHVYLPFLWDMLEDGSIGMKKLDDKKFYCEINLTLKDFGKVELLLAMYEKNKLDISIFASRDVFKKLVREHLTKLKQSLNSVGLIPMNIKLIDLKEPKVEKKEEKTNIYNQTTDMGLGINIKA